MRLALIAAGISCTRAGSSLQQAGAGDLPATSSDRAAAPSQGAVTTEAGPTGGSQSSSPLAADGGSDGAATGMAASAGKSAIAGSGPGPDSMAPRTAGQGSTESVAGADDFPSADSYPRLDAAMFGTPTQISAAFDLAEGPVWDHCEQRLLFTDVNNRKIHSFAPGGEVSVYASMTNYVNGMVFDPEGRLILAEMGGNGGGRITRMARDKTLEVLIDRKPNGGRFQTSDDLALRSDGTIYFSDPDITHGPHLTLGLGSDPFYHLKPGEPGKRELVAAGRGSGTNGIRLTRDMRTLLVVEYSGGNIGKYDVADDGSVKANGDLVTGLSRPDSLCLDVAGNVYVGVASGIQVLRPDGSKVTVLPVASNATNCTFGGPDGKTLFITAWSRLLKLDGMPVPGLDWHRNKRMKCD